MLKSHSIRLALREVSQTSRTALVLLTMHGIISENIKNTYINKGEITTLVPLYDEPEVLKISDIGGNITSNDAVIDFAAGNCSLVAELNNLGIEAIAVDRDFDVFWEEGPARISLKIDTGENIFHPAYWDIRVVRRLSEVMYMIAQERFDVHRETSPEKYIVDALPDLSTLTLPKSFKSKKRIFGFCSNLLFLFGYLEPFDANFHIRCIQNMMKFVDILSIYPTNVLGGGRSVFVDEVARYLEQEGYNVEFKPVPFANWANGSNEKMVVTVVKP